MPKNATENSDAKLCPAAIELVAAERKRQIDKEGWEPSHDDGHTNGALARAAGCYAVPPDMRARLVKGTMGDVIDWMWPFDEEWWKPSPDDRIRELVKAGALIVAEIERLQRLQD